MPVGMRRNDAYARRARHDVDVALVDIHRGHALRAVAEFDRLGRQPFLHQDGFGPARSHLLLEREREYDSRAIVGVSVVSRRGLPVSPFRFAQRLVCVFRVVLSRTCSE